MLHTDSVSARERVASPVTPVSDREVDLVRAILAEPSLADAARSLGLSPRQGRRLMADLRHNLSVSTNLQAVAAAVALGIVESPVTVRTSGGAAD